MNCLQFDDITIPLTFIVVSSGVVEAGLSPWLDYSLTGMAVSSAQSHGWDAPLTTLEDDSWCSPVASPTLTVTPGSVADPICFEWDGVWRSLSFTAPVATATAACTDPTPTWIYEVD